MRRIIAFAAAAVGVVALAHPALADEVSPGASELDATEPRLWLSILGPPGITSDLALVGAGLVVLGPDGDDVAPSDCEVQTRDTRDDSYDVVCDIMTVGEYRPIVTGDDAGLDVATRCVTVVDGREVDVETVVFDSVESAESLFCRISVGPPAIRISVNGVRPGDGLVSVTNAIIIDSSGNAPACVEDARLQDDDATLGRHLLWCTVQIGERYEVSAEPPPGGYAVRAECLGHLSIYRGNFGAFPPPIDVTEAEPHFVCYTGLEPPLTIRTTARFDEPVDVTPIVTNAAGDDVSASCTRVESSSEGTLHQQTFDCLDVADGLYTVEFANIPQIATLEVRNSCDEPILVGAPIPFEAAAPTCSLFLDDTSIEPTTVEDVELPESGAPSPDPLEVQLPETGPTSDSLSIAVLAIALAGVGGVLMASTRRRTGPSG